LAIATTKPPVGAGPVVVTVAVLELPPITVVGASIIASTVERVTVKVVDFDTPLADPLNVTVAFVATGVVVTFALAVVAPSGTVIEAGTVTAALFDVSATAKPPVGAGPASVTVTLDALPPITVAGFTETDSTALRCTVICADFDVPFADADNVAALSETTADVTTSKVTDVALRGTTTVAGTPTELESDVNATVNPPSGAGPIKVTVPVALPPPITLDGVTANAETPLRVIVKDPDLL